MAEGIDYPAKGTNGENILRESAIVIEPKPMIYSMRVDIIKGYRVRIIVPVPEDANNSWSYFRYAGMSVGWKHAEVFGDSNKEVHFMADSPGHADLPVYFIGHNTIDIKIFENDEENPTRVKKIIW